MEPDGGFSEQLTEERSLVNPARRLRTSELFSSTRPGVGRTAGMQFGLDDHRQAHVRKLDDEFARQVLHELSELIGDAPDQRLILCASPRILGKLRKLGGELSREGLRVHEIPRDLVRLTPVQLREQLASYGILPAVPPRSRAS